MSDYIGVAPSVTFNWYSEPAFTVKRVREMNQMDEIIVYCPNPF